MKQPFKSIGEKTIAYRPVFLLETEVSLNGPMILLIDTDHFVTVMA